MKQYKLRLEIGPLAPTTVVAVPYPQSHQQQSVQDKWYKFDGQSTDHGGFILLEQSSGGMITTTVKVDRFVQPIDLPDPSFQPITAANQIYLGDDQFIKPSLPAIQELVHRLIPDATVAPLKALKLLYEHTLEQLSYGDPYDGLYSTQDALDRPLVDCGGFSTYLGALARAIGIPSRIVAGFWAGYKKNTMHAWLECALPNGYWWPVDVSVAWLRQRGRSKKIGGFGEIGSDRIVISTGTDYQIIYNNKDYAVGFLQVPMILLPNGSYKYLSNDLYRIIT